MIGFFDRDGVLNRDSGYTHIFNPSLVFDDVEALAALNFEKLFIVTNQSGIERGYYNETTFHKFMIELIDFLLVRYKIKVDDYFYCPHSPDQLGEPTCMCRKPGIGMFLQAQKKYKINFNNCIMVGDKLTDIKSGMAAGIKQNIFLDRIENKPIVPSSELNLDYVRRIETLYEINALLN